VTEIDLLLMALALRLKAALHKDVCLAVPVKGPDSIGSYHSSVALDDQFIGHTALFNLVQHLDSKAPELLKEGAFYLTREPAASDIGIFIMRCNLAKSSNSILYFPRGRENIIRCKPTSVTGGEGLEGNLNVLETAHLSLASLDWEESRKRIFGRPLVPHDKAPESPDLMKLSVLFGNLDINFTSLSGKTIQVRVAPPVDAYTESARVILREQSRFLDYNALDAEGKRLFNSIFMLAAYALPICASHTDKPQGIGVILVKPDGKILAWGTDLSNIFHGEVTAVRRWQDALAESKCDRARLYTSLEPCNMCAGLLAMYNGPCRLAVLYGQQDTGVSGPGRQPTALKVRGSVTFLEMPLADLVYKDKDETAFFTKLNQKSDEFKSNLVKVRNAGNLFKDTRTALQNTPGAGFQSKEKQSEIVAALTALHKEYVAIAAPLDASASGGLVYQSTRRRLAKAAMRLAMLFEELDSYRDRKRAEGDQLLALWDTAQSLLSKAAGDEYTKVISQYLLNTKDKNILKTALEDPAKATKQNLATKPIYQDLGGIKNVVLTMLDSCCIAVPAEGKLSKEQGKIKETREMVRACNFAGVPK
jgi:tRNA(Arg) A34 adenosine deaminase TadA